MRQIMYAMQFKGQATPVSGSSNVLKAQTTAASCTFTTVVGPEGLSGTLQEKEGGKATFESEVTFTGESTFKESGTIIFGQGGHQLRFSTVGQGYLGPSADPKLKQGSVMWRIDSGQGQFEGASGLITSNFTVGDSGEVTDNHFGVIFV
jgi:hypothetical protein